jgi:hypothetical protein|tara:strand:+ start:1411 stop:1674 length:264 start_codon:yes stop_codon:yes gene_type:complete
MTTPLKIDGYERKIKDNPFNYTEDELQDKQIALKTMREIYPDVSPFYADIVYDLCKNNSKEFIEELKIKIDNTPSKYTIPEVLENLN